MDYLEVVDSVVLKQNKMMGRVAEMLPYSKSDRMILIKGASCTLV